MAAFDVFDVLRFDVALSLQTWTGIFRSNVRIMGFNGLVLLLASSCHRHNDQNQGLNLLNCALGQNLTQLEVPSIRHPLVIHEVQKLLFDGFTVLPMFLLYRLLIWCNTTGKTFLWDRWMIQIISRWGSSKGWKLEGPLKRFTKTVKVPGVWECKASVWKCGDSRHLCMAQHVPKIGKF